MNLANNCDDNCGIKYLLGSNKVLLLLIEHRDTSF